MLSDSRTETNDIVNKVGRRSREPSSRSFSISSDFQFLLQFYSNPWFRRLWVRFSIYKHINLTLTLDQVVQEALLPCRSTCIYGDHTVFLDEVLQAAAWLNYKRRSLPFDFYERVGLHHVLTLFDLGQKLAASKRISYCSLAVTLNKFETTDARDRKFCERRQSQFMAYSTCDYIVAAAFCCTTVCAELPSTTPINTRVPNQIKSELSSTVMHLNDFEM